MDSPDPTVRDRLRLEYGVVRPCPHARPLDELILTVLSQNTSDRNRDVAWGRLRAKFPSWRETARAPVAEIEAAIRPGGISRVKAGRIKEILRAVESSMPEASDEGDTDLDWLADSSREATIDFLTALPGVGRKTAACVMLFAWGRPEMPVDTHVFRVGRRLGLISADTSVDRAHDEILRKLNAEDVYEVHINLLRHGRRICRPRPKCESCSLVSICLFVEPQESAAGRHSHSKS